MLPAMASAEPSSHTCHGQDQTILPYTSLRHEDACQWRAPLGPTDNHRPDTEPCKKPCRRSSLLRVLRPQALRNTSAARRQAAKLCYRFDPLTPSARSANLIAGDGTKNGFPAPNKEQTTHQKRLLDRKSPIQVRIHLSPAASQFLDPSHLIRGGEIAAAIWGGGSYSTTERHAAEVAQRPHAIAQKIETMWFNIGIV